jgi:hypothetical protein
MKRKMTGEIYKIIDELKLKIDEIVEELITQEFIKNLCGFDCFFT